MKRLLKSKKGMSLLEVMIAIAILGVLAIPIMTTFMNTQIYAKKVDKQTEISAITRTVKQIVSEGMIKNLDMKDKDNNDVVLKDISGNIVNDSATFKELIEYCKTYKSTVLFETTYLQIMESNSPTANAKFMYTIGYDHSNFYNAEYPKVYNLEIKIFDRANSKLVDKIKVAIKTE